MTGDVLTVSGLTKVYGDTPVLDGVDLTVGRGEIVGFVGPNGSGKTTCMRCILGLTRRSGGTIDVLGVDPADDDFGVRSRACYLPGESSVYGNMTGREYLEFAASFYPDHHDGILASLGPTFELPLDQRVRRYSTGMKQKLAILACLSPDVDLYLLDEPDRALDATSRFALREALFGLRHGGKAVLLSSHHLSEVERVAERLVFLVGGRSVPPDRVEAVREGLSHRLRLTLHGETPLPPGHRLLGTEPDGTLHLETESDPVLWLRRLDADRVAAAEIGPSLEDIYRGLQESGTGAPP